MTERFPAGRKSGAIFNLGLLLVSVALLSGVAELATRYSRDAWPFETPMVTIAPLRPEEASLRWRFSRDGDKNSLGMRNREISEKSDAQLRILFLGDSLFWTSETSSGELYPQAIEENLDRRVRGQGVEIEVINAGIPGYSTYQELEFLRIHGLKWKPDLVVLGFVFNDLFNPYLHRPTAEKLLALEPRTRLHRFDTGSFPGRLLKNSYLAHEVAYVWERAIKKFTGWPYYSFERRADFYLAWKDYGWTETSDLIGGMRALLSSSGIPMMIVIFPNSEQVTLSTLAKDRTYVLFPQKKIGEICLAYDIPCLDLTEALIQVGARDLFKDYLHLNGAGNDIAGCEIMLFLLEHRLLWADRRVAKALAADAPAAKRDCLSSPS